MNAVVVTWGVILAIMGVLPVEAQERRACRATGYFLFTFHERVDGSMVTRTKRIDILQSDMEVVATSAGQMWSTATDAKRWACSQAAACFVQQAAGADTCGSSPLNVVYETIRKPHPIDDWRREVACNHAAAGNVQGLRKTSANTATLVQTKIVATASRDGITRNADQTVSEGGHVCWSPSASRGEHPPTGPEPSSESPRPKPSRTDSSRQPTRTDSSHQPSRTDSGHQPTRTDSSHQPGRTNPPSPIASIQATLTPPSQTGKCPASVLMQARLELRRPVEMRWWVTGEDGYQSPKYVRAFNEPQATLIWRRHIDPQPAAGNTMTQTTGKARAPVHQGYFQVHFETVAEEGRAVPLGESNRIPFTVDCNPEPPDRFKRLP